ncbi:MAG: peptidoglycan DD-metalloendopeptidase family protein [Firmicutes bacterium]|nr:peptidoglycan DD-metalloendopeptidase family protein [Bacillota bacterium]
MSAVFLKLLNMSISAVWIILAVAVFRLLAKRAPKWIVCLLWGLAGARLMLPFTVKSALSLIPSGETIPEDIMMSSHPVIASGIPAVDSRINPVIAESFTQGIVDSANPLQIWVPILAAVWILGMAAMLLYALVSYLKLRKTVAASVLLRDNIMLCDDIKSPFILGVIRPSIYMPSGLDASTMENVLRHENAHIQRKDNCWKPLGWLILAVHWFNPLCWLGYRLFCRDIELACDEKVIRDMDRESVADYSQALLSCAAERRLISACPLAFGEIGVKERIRDMFRYKKPTKAVIALSLMACLALAVFLMTDPVNAEGQKEQPELILEAAETNSELEKLVAVNNDVFTVTISEPAEQDPENAAAEVLITKLSASGWVWPVDSTEISSGFGTRYGAVHNGVDIVQSKGEPIYATSAGTVKSAGWQSGRGYTVEIEHGSSDNSIVTRYCHMDKISVEEGASVESGAVIGTVGSTGNSTGPHLHFELLLNGENVDPIEYLQFQEQLKSSN